MEKRAQTSAVMNFRTRILVVLVALAISSRAESDDPDRVRSTGTFGELRKSSTEVADTLGKRLDAGHDWLYRHLERLFEKIDLQFGSPPASADRGAAFARADLLRPGAPAPEGWIRLQGARDLEADLAVPNIERRLKLFVTSTDVQETPAHPNERHNPLSFGALFAPQSHLNLELALHLDCTAMGRKL